MHPWVERHDGARRGRAGAIALVVTLFVASAPGVAPITLCVASAAVAQDRWSDPHPGVRYLHRTASGPREIHVLSIDLCRAGVSLRATRETERRATVPSWASSVGVEAAINGDFFSYSTYLPSGAAMGDGVAWGPADGTSSGLLGAGTDLVHLSRDREVLAPLPSWMRQAVSGHPTILRAGAVVDNTGTLCTARHPRTSVGLSRDGRTLLLMVVDGRSSRSIGMTCAEQATTLLGLGAWDALNLDGGGSSTMWIRGSGVVNAPSDGAPRTVSNHLGVNAGGSGIPGSCMPWGPHEDELAAGDAGSTTTDVDGDGRADACARSSEGVQCALSTGSSFAAPFAGPGLSDARGWGDPANASTLVMGDVNGDGLADLCARANAGLRCWASMGSGFASTGIPLDDLADADGWDRPEHYATIRLADVDGDGDDDVCARARAGLRCWPSLGTAFGPPTAAIADLSNASGFDAAERWATLRMADVDGDGLADVCARTADGIRCWRSTGTGFDTAPIAGPAWTDARGWMEHRFYSTIRLADVDGDGRADVCGRTSAGLRCHPSTGDGFGAAIVLDAMTDAAGWDDASNYSTLELVDVDGDGDRDACARSDAGITCWPFEGGSFGAAIESAALVDTNGWWRAMYYRTMRWADIDGDGDIDLCARASGGLRCWTSDGGRFGDSFAGPEWSNTLGWWSPIYGATIRVAGPRAAARTVVPPDAGVAPEDAGAIAEDAGTIAPSDAMAAVDAADGPPDVIAGGCACRASPSTPAVPPACAVPLALALARRRRRRGCEPSR